MSEESQEFDEDLRNDIIDIPRYYYNPNIECTCGAVFADTHRSYCQRRKIPDKAVVLR